MNKGQLTCVLLFGFVCINAILYALRDLRDGLYDLEADLNYLAAKPPVLLATDEQVNGAIRNNAHRHRLRSESHLSTEN